MPVKLREQRIRDVLALVDLTDRKDGIVKHYSGGMRRRLELARGLMHRPKVLNGLRSVELPTSRLSGADIPPQHPISCR